MPLTGKELMRLTKKTGGLKSVSMEAIIILKKKVILN